MFVPSEYPLPLKDTRPVTLGATSFAPEPARLSCVTLRLTVTGVVAESPGLIGPAFPSSLIAPPPRTFAETENGKAEVAEKSRNSISPCSSTRGFQWPMVLRRVRRPLVTLTSCTERSSGICAEDGVRPDGAADFPPRLEKFQLPDGACTNSMSG